MTRTPTPADAEVFAAARDALRAHHHPQIHQVAAAVRTADGGIHVGLHLGSRRINICAESSAIANAVMSGAGAITTMAAVCRNDAGEVVVTNPCGVCRELMGTYAPEADVMVDDRGATVMVRSAELMPQRWMFPAENDWTPDDPTIA